jgi:enoyl-CoA hydratase/carnithine racemase
MTTAPDTAVLEFPVEIVTRSLVRYVELPLGAGTAALITLDNGYDHTKPSTIGPAGLRSLAAALDEVEQRNDVVAVALTGKPFVLAAGADTKGMARIASRDQARAVVRLGHDVFRRLGELSIPSFAYINGAALGGGLEVALHCTYRTVSSAAQPIGLPECFLGLVPAWGGSYLLLNLIGADAAVTVIIRNALDNNRTLDGRAARQLGIADAMFEPADFLEQSLLWTARVLRGDVKVQRSPVDRGAAWDTAIAAGREFADRKLHGAAPAPYRALDLMSAAKNSTLLWVQA